MVKLKYDKYQLRISLEGADKTKAIQVNNPTEGEVNDVLDPLPELTSSVRYNDILPATDLEYIVTGSNIKENIIVKEKGDSYVYEFNLRVKDITPVISDDGDVLFVNEDNETVFIMPKGYMYDSDGNRSENVTYTVEANGNKKYVLTVTADADWINAGHTGDIYFDDMQLETGSGASAVSLQHNGGMIVEESWTNSSAYGSAYTTVANTYLSHGRAIKVTGDISRQGYSYSTVHINAPSSKSTYTVSGWAKANSVPTYETDSKTVTPTFGLKVVLTYTDGSTSTHTGGFSSDITDWQFISVPVVPTTSKTISTAKVYLSYDYNSGTAYFDNISFVKDNAVLYTYDEKGNVKTVNTAEETKDLSTDYENGNLMKLVCPDEGTYNYKYNDNHQVTSVTCDGLTMTLDRDTSTGLVKSSTLTGTGTTSKIMTLTEYDAEKDKVKKTTDALGNATQYRYNETTGYNDLIVHPNLTRTKISYNTNNGRVNKVYAMDETYQSDLDSNASDIYYGTNYATINYSYASGRLASIYQSVAKYGTAYATQRYRFTYDAFGNMTQVTVGDKILSSRTYNQYNGNLLSQTNGSAQTINYTYDTLDRITKAEYNGGGTIYENSYTGTGQLYSTKDHIAGLTAIYNYDQLGRLLDKTTRSSSDGSFRQSVSYLYDTSNRISKVYYSFPGVNGWHEGYTYDADDGSLSKFRALNGDEYTYTYDNLKRLSKVSVAHENDTSLTFHKNYTYANQTTDSTKTSTVPNQITYTNGSDTWLTSFGVYDNMGRLSRVADSSDSVNTAHIYTYDDRGQLTEEYFPLTNTKFTYTYDGAGNMFSWQQVNTSTNKVVYSSQYDYTNAQWYDMMAEYNGQTVTYSDTGVGQITQLTSAITDATKGFAWNNEGRLSAVNYDADYLVYYTYDADGMRKTKRSDGTVHEYYYEGSRLVKETIGNKTLIYLYDENGAVDAIMHNGVKYYLIKNIQGDVIQIRSKNNELVANYLYNAYGLLLSVTNASGSIIKSSSHIAIINPIRYRGYYYDTDTQMYYLQSRYYDPELCRFISADSYASTGQGMIGSNMFAYCGNDPVNRKDSSGQFWFTAIVITTVVACVVTLTACSNEETPIRNSNEPRADLATAPDLNIETADPKTYNCYGNGIGKQITTNPTGYSRGDSTRQTFEAVKNDLGNNNVRELTSIDAPIEDDEFKVAMKCGATDYHFIRLTENGWFNKSGRYLAGVYLEQHEVASSVWMAKGINDGEIYWGTPYYDDETIYFAVKIGWDD